MEDSLVPPRLGSLVEAELESVVRRVTGRSALSIVDSHWRVLHGGHAVTTGGIYRIWGTADDPDGNHAWSVVLKLVRPAGNITNEPTYYAYWRREWFVYAVPDAVLPSPADNLAAPRCFGAGEDDEGYWLWLEDIVETAERPWPLAQYGLAARHLGVFNGRFLVDRSLPRYSWLTTDVLRTYAAGYDAQWASLAELRDSPLARRGWPAEQLDRMRAMWGKRDELLAAEAWLPRTVCHGDAVNANLLARTTPDGIEQTVAIDWAFAGIGPLGLDLATLFRSALGPVDDGYLATLDRVVFTGYLDGLVAVGWNGDHRLVRLGFAVAVALRYALNPLSGFTASITDDESRRTLELFAGMPFEDFLDGVVRVRNHGLQLAVEALGLYRILSHESDVGGGPVQ
jgi:hypothetical protein